MSAVFTVQDRGAEYSSIIDGVVVKDGNVAEVTELILNHPDKENSFAVMTDAFAYTGVDQILPLQPEQLFVIDEFKKEKLNNGRALEIGLGSGVLSIAALRAGAERVVGLDINPRAKVAAGFNAVMNGYADNMEIRCGSTESLFGPVADETFEYIFSNPPFEPTPDGFDYFVNSAAGIYGLSFIDTILSNASDYLTEDGHCQIVTMAPGIEDEPTLLIDMINRILPSRKVDLVLDLCPIGYDTFVDRFTNLFEADPEGVQAMKEQAAKDGVTHIHFVMIHFDKSSEGTLSVEKALKCYETWETPLGSEEPDTKLRNSINS